LVEVLCIDGRDLEKTQDDHVSDHGPLTTPLVTCEAEQGSTNRSQQQSECDGFRDIGLGDVVVLCQLYGLDRKSVKVESIGGPGSETDKEEDPVHGCKLCHQAERVSKLGRSLPLGRSLATLVVDNYSLLPFEEVRP
jgi:hypothetical protein